jgi:hypothetical protein
MSNMYGRAAVRAAQMLQESTSSDPEAAWKRAITLETESKDSRDKPCPRGAFLGLCGGGHIPGCSKRSAFLRNTNGDYAVRMLRAIQKDESLLGDRERLWKAAIGRGRDSPSEQGQIDVVVSLWTAGLIQ